MFDDAAAYRADAAATAAAATQFCNLISSLSRHSLPAADTAAAATAAAAAAATACNFRFSFLSLKNYSSTAATH